VRLLGLLWWGAVISAEVLPLREAVERAARLSPEVAVARLKAVEAAAEADVARSAYLPQVSVQTGISGQTTNLQGIGLFIPGFSPRVGPYSVFDARPRLTQTVLDWSLLESIRAARKASEESRFRAEAAREATQLAVAEMYLEALQADSRVAASAARLATAQALLKQAQDREQAGASSKLDVARAEQEFRVEEATRIQAARDRDLLKASLARLIGLEETAFDLERFAIPAGRLLPPPVVETRVALEARAEIRAEQAAAERESRNLAAARREYLPKIAFAADYGVLGASPWNSLSTYTIGGTVTIPVWTSGRIENSIGAARARLDQAREIQRSAKLRVEEEVRRALLEWEAAHGALIAAERATAAARESVELSRLRFDAGLSTNIDTVTAQSRLAEAEDFEIRTRYDLYRAQARHARSMGGILSFLEGL
jgi:outer membrane protein TolC